MQNVKETCKQLHMYILASITSVHTYVVLNIFLATATRLFLFSIYSYILDDSKNFQFQKGGIEVSKHRIAP